MNLHSETYLVKWNYITQGFDDLNREFSYPTKFLQGKAGVIPTVKELSFALQNRDLFLYFGHGSGKLT